MKKSIWLIVSLLTLFMALGFGYEAYKFSTEKWIFAYAARNQAAIMSIAEYEAYIQDFAADFDGVFPGAGLKKNAMKKLGSAKGKRDFHAFLSVLFLLVGVFAATKTRKVLEVPQPDLQST